MNLLLCANTILNDYIITPKMLLQHLNQALLHVLAWLSNGLGLKGFRYVQNLSLLCSEAAGFYATCCFALFEDDDEVNQSAILLPVFIAVSQSRPPFS